MGALHVSWAVQGQMKQGLAAIMILVLTINQFRTALTVGKGLYFIRLMDFFRTARIHAQAMYPGPILTVHTWLTTGIWRKLVFSSTSARTSNYHLAKTKHVNFSIKGS